MKDCKTKNDIYETIANLKADRIPTAIKALFQFVRRNNVMFKEKRLNLFETDTETFMNEIVPGTCFKTIRKGKVCGKSVKTILAMSW